MYNKNLSEETTLDSFLNGAVKAYQFCDGYKSGVDAVILSSLVDAKAGDKILDIGCGVGVVSLLIAKRIKKVEVLGIEKVKSFFELAQLNASINSFAESSFVPTYGNIMVDSPFKEQFDVIVTNPPYYKDNHTNNNLKDIANIESDASLLDFINFAFKNLKNHGYLYIIQRSERLKELLDLLVKKHWGNIEIFPIYSYINKDAKRCVIKVKKLGKDITKMHFGIIMHNSNSTYSTEAKLILEEGKSFIEALEKNS